MSGLNTFSPPAETSNRNADPGIAGLDAPPSGTQSSAEATQVNVSGHDVRSIAADVQPMGIEQPVRKRSSRLTKADLLLITTQLSIMTRSGMDLADAIANIGRHSQNANVRTVLETLHRALQDGQSFSAALRAQIDVFGETYVASVAAGEASGKLVDVLTRLTDLLRKEVHMRSTIRGALMYPVALLFVAVVVVGAMMFFVLPQFDKVFQNMQTAPPALTRMLLSVGKGLRSHAWLALGGMVVTIFGMMRLWSHPVVRNVRDRALLQTRWIRGSAQTLLTGRSFRLLGTMLQSGVPLLDAIRLCRRAVNNVVFHELFEHMEAEILSGRGIAGVLANARCVPMGTAEMVATAEQSGHLGSVLEMVGEAYEDEGERKVRDLMKLLEPAIIVVMGGLVAVVVASVMLPLFDLSSSSSY